MVRRLTASGLTRAFTLVLASIAIPVSTAYGQVSIFVDADAPAGGTGQLSAWADPLQDLQAAIDLAETLFPTVEVHILVAEGQYRPKPTVANPGRARTFQVSPTSEQLYIHGGFLGFGVPGASDTPDLPDGSMVRTVLSGEPYVDPVTMLTVPQAYHVVRLLGGGTVTILVLDGFTITGGLADDPSFDENTRGAGVHVQCQGRVILENLVLYKNRAWPMVGDPRSGVGAGVFSSVAGSGGDDVWIRFCTFRENYAARGSALYYDSGPDLRVGNSKFMLNGSLVENLNPEDNSLPPACELGGAVYLGTQTHFRASNSTFFDNAARSGGGAICWEPFRSLNMPANDVVHAIWHSTFTLNQVLDASAGTGQGSAIHALPGDTNYGAVPIKQMNLYNSIIWGNKGGQDIVILGDYAAAGIDGVRIEVHDSDLGTSASFDIAPPLGMPWAPGVYTLGGTISVLPEFVSVVQRNLRLGPLSPCLNSASASWLGAGTDIVDVNGVLLNTDPLDLDLDLTARIKGVAPDMGAFEL